MKSSNLAKAAAVATLTLGFGALAAPAAFADIYVIGNDGDVAVQEAEANGIGNDIEQSAQNEYDFWAGLGSSISFDG
ncbi:MULTISPECIES: hypothetical protein [Saccharopolyspora]|uniref:Porin n=1 Tax=Saccharopolyspora cebuensis TaxID=418759 RepID=A0ABV4CNW9_9PSEU